MGQDTSIAWTHHTFNGVRGCEHCFAWQDSKRFPKNRGVWGVNGTRVVAAGTMWREPLKWDRAAGAAGERRRVFCASPADVFEDFGGQLVDHNGHPMWVAPCGRWVNGVGNPTHEPGWRPLRYAAARSRLWDLILATPWLDWLLPTKRPENVLPSLQGVWQLRKRDGLDDGCLAAWIAGGRPPSNVWLGVSVEDQATADDRIPHLLKTPAAVRFVSAEPLLGPLDLSAVLPGIDLVIAGGESGPGARPMHPLWAESLRDQCVKAGTPFFFKQWGSYEPMSDAEGYGYGLTSEMDAAEIRSMTKGVLVVEPEGKSVEPKGSRRWWDDYQAECWKRYHEPEDPENDLAVPWAMHRVGKKAAGRLLDGREWGEMPRGAGPGERGRAWVIRTGPP